MRTSCAVPEAYVPRPQTRLTSRQGWLGSESWGHYKQERAWSSIRSRQRDGLTARTHRMMGTCNATIREIVSRYVAGYFPMYSMPARAGEKGDFFWDRWEVRAIV